MSIIKGGCVSLKMMLMAVFISVSFWAFPSAAIDRYENMSIRNFRHGDGIVDAWINCMMKDCDGFMWFGTLSNVLRFDGIGTECYTFPLGEKAGVNKILQNVRKEILVGCNNGIWKVNPRNKSLERIYAGIKTSVKDMTDYGDGILVLASDAVYSVTPDGNIKKTGMGSGEYFSVVRGDHNEFYLLKSYGILLCSGGGVTDLGNGNISYRFTCMTSLGDYLLLGTDGGGLYKFDKKTRCFSHYLDIGNNDVSSLSSNMDIIVVGTTGTGVAIVPRHTHEGILHIDSNQDEKGRHLAFDGVKDVFIDNLNIIWIGYTRNVGFDYIQFNNKAFNPFAGRDKLPGDIEFSRIFVNDSVKLFGSFNGVYSVDKSGVARHYSFPNLLRNIDKEVKCFFKFGNDILVGTTSGVYTYGTDSEALKLYGNYPDLSNRSINMISSLPDGSMLIASDSGIVRLDSGGHIECYSTSNSELSSDIVKYIFVDRKERVWVATSESVQLFDFRHGCFKDSGNLFKDIVPVTFMTEDNDGGIIAIKNRQSAFLIKSSGKKKRICSTKDAEYLGLFIEKVLQDRHKNYWFIGSRGVVKGNPSLSYYTLFSSTEGFIEPYSNDGQIHNDTLWVTTPKGVLHTDINSTIYWSPTRITDIVVNGESKIGDFSEAIESGGYISLSEDDDIVTFKFATLSYDMPSRMIYEYKLEGIDDEWKILRGISSVSYNNLRPGEYCFVVRKQMDNSSISQIHIRVNGSHPWPYYIVGLIAIMAVIYIGVLFMRQRKMGESKKEVEKPVELSGDSSQETEKYRFNRLDEKVADDITQRLKEYMKSERPYMNPDLKLINVADRIGVSPQILSQVLNTCLNIRFNDYINQFRIEEFKETIDSEDRNKYTLQSLAKQCGFSSYSTFFRSFKEQTGMTPNEYIKGALAENEDIAAHNSSQTII